ncbi:MAG: hypothetical protein ABIR24_08970 [Verrucomicrobiota bacterium]
MNERKRWFVVVVFAIAMAWVESAVVFYLRTMIDRIEPYQANPLPVFGGLAKAELIREFATLVMLFTVGMLAGKSWRSRVGYAAIAFGVWDIFYYVFLKILCPWPNSLLDWDILFLLPLPWWGPILAPVSIAILMILWGTLASQIEQPRQPLISSAIPWTFNLVGMIIALYVFMADALHFAAKGETALRTLLPTDFKWALFGVALVLMAAPLASELRLIFGKRILLGDGQNRKVLTVEKAFSL